MENEHKFKVGDTVKIVLGGQGTGDYTKNKIVTITECGPLYKGGSVHQPGYVIEPKLGNCRDGGYEGVIGESSFELVKTGLYDIY